MSASEDYDFFSSVVEKLGLDEKEGKSFIDSAMGRMGHKARAVWDDADDDDSGGGGDFFSQGKSQRRSTGRQGGRGGQSGNGKGWQYTG